MCVLLLLEFPFWIICQAMHNSVFVLYRLLFFCFVAQFTVNLDVAFSFNHFDVHTIETNKEGVSMNKSHAQRESCVAFFSKSRGVKNERANAKFNEYRAVLRCYSIYFHFLWP